MSRCDVLVPSVQDGVEIHPTPSNILGTEEKSNNLELYTFKGLFRKRDPVRTIHCNTLKRTSDNYVRLSLP